MRAWIVAVVWLIAAVGWSQITWEDHWVDEHLVESSGVHVIDVDGDGWMDIVAAGETSQAINWYQNNGDGTFAVAPIGTELGSVHDVIGVDLDQDGDTDVAGVSGSGVYWWENDGAELFTSHTIAGPTQNWNSLVAADFNLDGALDLVTASRYNGNVCSFTWFENDGAQSFTEHIIDDEIDDGIDVRAADVDLDGDVDLVTAAYYKAIWWENDGSGNFTEHLLEERYGDPQWALYTINVGDVDSDGDNDVVAASYYGEVIWYQHDGAGNFARVEIHHQTYDSRDIYVVDLNEDGNQDLVTVGHTDGIIWWYNDGAQNFEEIVVNDMYELCRASLGDLDNDGDLDIAAGSDEEEFPPMGVYWIEQIRPEIATLTLTPTSLVEIPASGGTLIYDVQFVSTLPGTYPGVSYRTFVMTPNDVLVGPLFTYTFTVTPFMAITQVGLQQDVPAFAPPGTYTYLARIGYPQQYVEGEFEFYKLTTSTSTTNVTAWSAHGWDPLITGTVQNDVATDQAPDQWTLSEVWPNPFNERATVQVALPDAGELTVAVYNVNGQQVATLAAGHHSAGTHTFSLDASGLASGVYFVRAALPGEQTQVRKVMLVR